MKKILKNQDGFTLIEILIVIAIIAILFVVLLPQIDFAGDKARQTGVRNNLHSIQLAAESYLRESGGQDLTGKALNTFLDPAMELKIKSGELFTLAKDPWGTEYQVLIYADNDDPAIVVKSYGKDKVLAGAKPDDFIFAAYYKNGRVTSCSAGFDTNNIVSDLIADEASCGVNKTGGATPLDAGSLKTDLD